MSAGPETRADVPRARSARHGVTASVTPNIISTAVTWLRLAWVPATLALMLVLFVTVSLPLLGAQGYWTDEQLSVAVANEKLGTMLLRQSADIHPPAYSTLLWLWIRITGTNDEAVVRLVSLAAMTTGLGILTLATWRRFSAGAALIVVVLGTTSSLVALFAREARPHGLAFAATCLVTAVWLYALDSPRARQWVVIGFGVAGGVAALTQYYALLVYVVELVALGLVLATRRGWRSLWQLGVIAAGSLVPVAAWMSVSLEALRRGSSAPTLDGTWAASVAGWAGEPFTVSISQSGGPVRFIPVALAAALAVSGLLVATWRLRATGQATDAGLMRSWACVGIAVVLVTAAVAHSLAASPSLSERTVLVLLPVLYAAFAAAWTLPFERWMTPAGAATAAVLLVVALRAPDPSMPNEVKDQWREAAAAALAEVRSGLPAERIALVEPWWGGRSDWTLMLNNAVDRQAPATDLPPELAAVTWITQPEQIGELSTSEPLYLLAFHYWDAARHQSIVDAVTGRFGRCADRSLVGITVLACDPSSG